jgi:hypothetical protein
VALKGKNGGMMNCYPTKESAQAAIKKASEINDVGNLAVYGITVE